METYFLENVSGKKQAKQLEYKHTMIREKRAIRPLL